MEGSIKDTEALVGSFTNKRNDSPVSENSFRYKRKKKIYLRYLIFLAISGFAVVGIVSTSHDLKSYAQTRRSTEALSAGGGYTALELKGPTNKFDGHIGKSQTKTISKLSKLVGVEPNGGEKTIRKLLKNVADVNTPYSKQDIFFSWEVAAFGDMAKAFCKCFQVNMAASFGMDELGDPNLLQPIKFDGNMCNAYNVNLSTRAGISRAKKLGLGTYVVPDLISSPFLPEIASLFTSERKGRIILAVPNVNVRLGMTYGMLSSRGLISGSYLEFVSSNHVLANNYMTRMLSGKWGSVEELTQEDFNVAATIIKEKFIVAPWSGNRNIAKYVIDNANWDANGFECMYPPPVPQTEVVPPPPPPARSVEDLAADLAASTAIQLHNRWDEKLFNIIVNYASVQFSEVQ